MNTKRKLLVALILALTFTFSAADLTPAFLAQTTTTVAYAKPKKKNKKTNKNKKEKMVWLTATGKKYHSTNHCGRTNPKKAYQVKESEAKAEGFEPCSKCW